MSAFGKIVASPFVGLGWVAGQVKNGYDAARNRVQPVMHTVTNAAATAVDVTKKAAKTAASSAHKAGVKVATATRSAAKSVATGVVETVKAVGRVVRRTLNLMVEAARRVLAIALLLVIVVAALAIATTLALATIAFYAVGWTLSKIVGGLTATRDSVVNWARSDRGATTADVLRQASAHFGIFGGAFAVALALALVAGPALGLAVSAAAVHQIAMLAVGAGGISAATLLASLAIESQHPAGPDYYPGLRRVLVDA